MSPAPDDDAPRRVVCLSLRPTLAADDTDGAPAVVPAGELPEDAEPDLTVGDVYEVLDEPFPGWITVEDDTGEECCFPEDLFGPAG
ncbi:MAG: hypothetical protein K8T90_06225 [Planctomycetes bacterium]|nr:hypothetical protein [Planctomycetota bacterium]